MAGSRGEAMGMQENNDAYRVRAAVSVVNTR